MFLIHGIMIGIIIGLWLGWKIHAWWSKSALKKTANAVGSATKGPTQAAKGVWNKLKNLLSDDDKKKKE